MRLGTITNIIFVVALVGTPIYMVLTPKPPAAHAPAPSTAPTFATFCHSAHLVPKAVDDCDRMMKAATTDDDRARVERTFAMGGVKMNQATATAKP